MAFRLSKYCALAVSSPLVLALAGCGSAGSTNEDPGSSGGGASQAAEPAYCGTTTTYSGGVSVTGTAQFQYRPVSPTTGLGALTTANIPFAEIQVANSSGVVVQCSTTDANGAISLTVPAGAASYTLKVLSRSDTSKVKISVLEDYYANTPYSISTTFSVGAGTTSVSAGTLTATGSSSSSKLEGGAFNIYNQIYKVNEFLRTKLSDSSFVAPKVQVYWKKGFNPYTYFGGSSLVSFYRMGTGHLFILGGNNGDVVTSDTDHFDNSVIVHEYGHFLEDKFAIPESPGGSHYLNTIIDPRLAWSEGWANFFQGAVLNAGDSSWKYYVDTIGDGTGSGSKISVRFELTSTDGRCSHFTGDFSQCDNVTQSGEGTFREVSITRFLFKTINTIANGGAEIPFSAVWSVFSGGDVSNSPTGFASTQISFRNIGSFNAFLRPLINANYSSKLSGWDSIRSNEEQNADSRNYGDTLSLVTENSCAVKSMSPTIENSTTNDTSNQFKSNAFYQFDYDGIAATLKLEYSGGTSSGGLYHDLDLYLYREDYVYQETGEDSTGGVVLSSARAPSIDGGVESFSLAGVPAGRYMINVKAYTLGKTTSELGGAAMTYRLKLTHGSTTEDLCPAH